MMYLKDGRDARGWYAIYCGKVRSSPESALCPHCELLVAEEGSETQKKMLKARSAKAYKKEMRESLKDSPLAAINPAVPEGQGAYSK